jgi:hypothetical protein
MMMRRPRQKDQKHLEFVRQLPCVICGDDCTVEAAHVRYHDEAHGKRQCGMGEKPDDKWALPLCGQCHREQHAISERVWWLQQSRDPIKLAMAIYLNTGDHMTCTRIAREGGR